MSKGLKIVLGILIAIFLIIQLIPVDRPESLDKPSTDLMNEVEVPVEIKEILIAACYDCHSVEVKYPWYAYVAPVSFLVARDVNFGQANLNLSEWSEMDKGDKIHALEEMLEEVEEGHMPMPIYTITHSDAKLTAEQRKAFVNWCDKLANEYFEQ